MVACILLVSCNANAYTEAGVAGNTSSWESAEYKKDWGLTSMNASTAYSMGFDGSGVNIGVMDSGILTSHPEFQDGRFHIVKSAGEYSKDGMRYPDAAYGNGPINKNEPVKNGKRNYDKTDNGKFKKGESFDIDGGWIKGVNDAHGTHVGGTMAASRDGSEMHGVAYKANLYSANTGGNDNMTYGPNQDYNYFLKSYTALADKGVKVINNSWGSNRRVNSSYAGALGYKSNYDDRYIAEYQVTINDLYNITQTTDKGAHIYLKDIDAAKQAYYQFVTSGEKNFVDAAYEVAIKRQVIQVFTAGNRNLMAESFTRAALPYFRPNAEKYWINVTGQAGGEGYPNDKNAYVYNNNGDSGQPMSDIQEFNEAGHSKWWTIAAPSESIYSSYVELTDNATYGKAIYKSSGGTSMAAPHVSGALGVIFQRYPYLSVSQARDVMLTTARQYTLRPGLEGKPLERWGSQGAGVPSEVWGWGILDLGKAMFGPGQFLGKFDVTMNVDDIWSNDISDTAIKFRKTEDDNDAATWAARKAVLEAKANLTAEEKAELAMEAAREKARALRAAEGYEGSLVKRGLGTLTLVGDNSFTGTTTIYGGKISALNQSLKNSKIIVENGGALEILKSRTYYTPSSNGWHENTKNSTADVVKATINSGGAFLLSRPGSSNVDITFNKGSLVGISPSADDLVEMMNSSLVKKGYSAQGVFNGYENANFSQEYAFFDLTKEEFSASKLKISVKKNDKAMIDFASSANQNRIAKFIEDSAVLPASNAGAGFRSAATSRLKTSDLYRNLLIATPQQARDTFKTLANDANFAAQNTSMLNAILLRNIISNHKANLAATNVDQKESGLNFWTATMAHNFKYDSTDIKSRTFAQVFGADGALSDRTRLGGVLALTRTTTKSDGEKDYKTLNSSFGVYSQTDLGDFRINAGATYTKGNRHKESTSSIVQYVSNGNTKNKEILATLYADIGYNGISVGDFSLTPYLGASYINAKTKSSQQQIDVYTMSTSKDSRDIGVATIGINPSYAFGKFNANANIAYNRLFGQKAPGTTVGLGSNGSIDLEGEELKDLTTVDAGVEANIFKNAYLRLSYVGAFGSDVKSNGINAKFSWSF